MDTVSIYITITGTQIKMPNYDFEKDLVVSIDTEHEIANLLRDKYKAIILDFSIRNDYDIKAIVNGKPFTFEVKEDFTCERTGNVGLEYECRGKLSGISTSKANFYIYKIHTNTGIEIYLFKTASLKRAIENKDFFTTVSGGDLYSNSKNYLFKYNTFILRGKRIR